MKKWVNFRIDVSILLRGFANAFIFPLTASLKMRAHRGLSRAAVLLLLLHASNTLQQGKHVQVIRGMNEIWFSFLQITSVGIF